MLVTDRLNSSDIDQSHLQDIHKHVIDYEGEARVFRGAVIFGWLITCCR